MIVVDASVILEVLLRTPVSAAITQRLFSEGEELAAPHLIDLEIAQGLRRYTAFWEMDGARAEEALLTFLEFPLIRYPHNVLIPRLWALRKNVTVYDAAYLVLAEVLDAPFFTCDSRLAKAPGHRARVELA